jgi:acetyltransferase-like isoleucine patch superfamily enzyme
MSIEAGSYTYGQENIKIVWQEPGTKVILGKFCSIAADQKAYLGGNHRVDWVTTFPFGHTATGVFNVGHIPGHPSTNGDIIIGNDVWIGIGCTLMSGVKIGDGAVIAAHSHVVKDIAPYTLAGGNPALPIKLRFEQRIVDALMELKWWDLEVDVIKTIVPDLCLEPNYDKLQELIQKYRR